MSLGFGFSLPAYLGSGGAFAGATLNLDFTSGNQTLDPRITFTRSTTATFYNSAGVLSISPFNLLLQSQDFTTTWGVSAANATVTANTTVAPDGTTTADTLTEDLATGIHACFQNVITSGVVTFSVFAKLGSGTRFLTIAVTRDITHNGSATFDLSLGTNTQTQANGGIYASPSATITAVAQGFYRCTFTVTTDTVAQVRIGLNNTGTPTTNNRGLGVGYTGNGTSSLILWGAQLETGTVATTYIRTEATASGAPRFDYNPTTLASLGLLIEEQRTNLLLNTSVLGTQVVTVTAAAHTLSFYGTGTIVLSGAFTGTVTGTGAYPTRTILTFTPIVGVLTVTVTGSVTSAQLEAGAFPTSYIPTVASQETRAADVAVMTGTNFSSWYNASEGTLYGQADWLGLSTNDYFFSLNNGTSSNIISLGVSLTPATRFIVINGGVTQASIAGPTPVANVAFKIAGAYQANSFAAATNGTLGTVDTSGTVPSVNQVSLTSSSGTTNQFNGHIRQIAYYPRRLANAELQGITR